MIDFIIKNYKLLIVLSILAILLSLLYIAADSSLTDLENILLQIIFLAIGSVISYIFGRQSADDAAKKIIRSHAKPAFRGLLSLYVSLSRAASEIRSLDHSESPQNYQVILARIEVTLIDQLMAADNALEHWRDIVPEEVKELEQRLASNTIQRG